MIANGLFTSLVNYCLPGFGNVWFNGDDTKSMSFTKEDCRKLQVLQNKVIRLKTVIPKTTPPSVLIQQSGDLSIQQLTAFHSLVMTYKITRTNKPDYLAKKLKLMIPNETNIFPHRQAYTIPMSGNLSVTRSGCCYRSARLYNTLPLQLRRCNKVTSFKREVKKFVKENIAIKPA